MTDAVTGRGAHDRLDVDERRGQRLAHAAPLQVGREILQQPPIHLAHAARVGELAGDAQRASCAGDVERQRADHRARRLEIEVRRLALLRARGFGRLRERAQSGGDLGRTGGRRLVGELHGQAGFESFSRATQADRGALARELPGILDGGAREPFDLERARPGIVTVEARQLDQVLEALRAGVLDGRRRLLRELRSGLRKEAGHLVPQEVLDVALERGGVLVPAVDVVQLRQVPVVRADEVARAQRDGARERDEQSARTSRVGSPGRHARSVFGSPSDSRRPATDRSRVRSLSTHVRRPSYPDRPRTMPCAPHGSVRRGGLRIPTRVGGSSHRSRDRRVP